jgi:type II secretory ATPase GspE/PulE/Tfp pilus assembly ATPase PilB-like protein/CheY-like chemotaxis protein
LSDAVRDGASDIHIQPVSTIGVVRFRVDGVMRTVMQLPLNAVGRVISRIKVLSMMDIADHVRPQDGRSRLQIKGNEYDLRVSTVPVSGGEKAVIRILAPMSGTKVADLGLPGHELERVDRLLRLRDGIVAVTGPTGSGKTTTLYSALRQLATGETNIVTVEDPIEYRLPGISQTQADTKRGVTFASALRAMLRQDPDVILIGEMRDAETAGIALQAAMTGHLVLATLHTNDAVGTIPRLADLGIERGGLADTLRGALAQRLLRRLCRVCTTPINGQLNEKERQLAQRYGVAPTMRANGCDECGKLGYRGRLPVVEVMVITAHLQELIAAGASTGDLQRAAVAGGMRPIAQVALDHVKNGLTTLEEVERVLGEAETDTADLETTEPRVLLVDDDPIVRQISKFVLNTAGYKVIEAEDGRAGLDYIRHGDPVSLVVLDLDMPGLSGLDVLEALRADRATMSLPVVVLTGAQGAEAKVMDAGADDYIRKPLEPEPFLSRIKAVLRRSAM